MNRIMYYDIQSFLNAVVKDLNLKNNMFTKIFRGNPPETEQSPAKWKWTVPGTKF